ncbi:hypothetical protein [Reinekea marinisedimentorum]|uniref:Transposase IS166 family protein n=1 Tax=Reinekea marinisedimentorum TaxID=230495 RepID=A0A4R3HX17_9GAMM|nr:hypothetical protein [Reinekea marinisedimentorum]TCS36705.1 transposase IS166 family protein [Reinekea marinisedimentorum]
MNPTTSASKTAPITDDLLHPSEVEKLRAEVEALRSHNRIVEAENRALKRELFGAKSERCTGFTPEQNELADLPGPLPAEPAEPSKEDATPSCDKGDDQKTSSRGKAPKKRTGSEINATGLRFDENVPVREVIIEAYELKGGDADQYEVVGYKEVSHIVQKTSAYEVVVTKRQIVKRKDSSQLITAPLPDMVFESSIADVSFAVGLLVNKYQ